MKRIGRTWWCILGLVTILWLIAEWGVVTTPGASPLRNSVLQYTGLLAMSFMSVAMILATRPRWAEHWLGGLDKMYRLHKWVGIGALVLSIGHWFAVNAPKWAGALGWLPRAPRGARAASSNSVEQWLRGFRGIAESLGEWAFYGVVILVAIDVPHGWPGHEPGQFAFVTSDTAEGAHPYTMASAWQAGASRIAFVVKELGDHTRRLRELLRIGQSVRVEGPYGRFTFAGDEPGQIWIGGGVGITPFIARMKYLATQSPRSAVRIDLFHATAEADDTAFDKLRADAAASGVHLHLLVDALDGFLTAARIRDAVPAWRESSVWFCGPAALGDILSRDLAAFGFPVGQRFHQELFAMR